MFLVVIARLVSQAAAIPGFGIAAVAALPRNDNICVPSGRFLSDAGGGPRAVGRPLRALGVSGRHPYVGLKPDLRPAVPSRPWWLFPRSRRPTSWVPFYRQ